MAQVKSSGRSIRIMFQDEARFVRISDPKSCWAMFPIRPTVGTQMVREYVYVFGAVSPQDGRHDSLILPWANTEAMSMFLEEVRKRHPDEYIVMFMDQAGWHRAQKLRIPHAMELVFLPPYSPDLNLQEQIWDELREKFFSNRLFKSLQAVIETADIGLRQLESTPALIKSLSHRNWILNTF
jgi:transposase